MRRSALYFIALFLVTASIGHCQSALKLGTLTELWPEIGLSFRAYCDGEQNLSVQNTDFTLSENGRLIPDFTIWCPEKYVHAASSVALVLDASASMAGAGNAAAKLLSHTFVDMIDGVIDEATVTHFNDNAATYQAMTTIKPMLRSAIDALGVHGGSALYDALYLSVVEVAFNSQNPMKALIVVTDSRNDSSFRSLSEVIDLAKLHKIPIHMISLGSETDTSEMRMITSETGGRLFLGAPNGGQ
ncbi:MAG: vWA domain-containing protein, partial [Bacteroidota bacterium]